MTEPLWNLDAMPVHMQQDGYKRNENIKAGKKLCPECEGTGNMFISMHRTCDECNGKGSVL